MLLLLLVVGVAVGVECFMSGVWVMPLAVLGFVDGVGVGVLLLLFGSRLVVVQYSGRFFLFSWLSSVLALVSVLLHLG